MLLLIIVLGVRPAAVAALQGVAQNLRNNPLCSVDSSLREAPFHLCQLELGSLGLLGLAGGVQVVDLQTALENRLAFPRGQISLKTRTNLGEQIGDASDDTSTAHSQGRGQPVTLSCKGREILGLKASPHPRDLCNTTTCKLNTDNVGVLAQSLQHLRVDIKPSNDTGEVVNSDGQRAGIGKLQQPID